MVGASKASALFSVPAGDALCVFDLRPAARRPLAVLPGLARVLHDACDATANARALAEAGFAARGAGPEEVGAALDALVADRLLLRDGERHLALAVPLGRFAPEGRARDRFWRIARALGTLELVAAELWRRGLVAGDPALLPATLPPPRVDRAPWPL